MQAKHWGKLWIVALASFVVSSCGSDSSAQSSGGRGDYNQTKTMVLDILKTEDGQKAISEALTKSGGGSSSGAASQANMMQILSTGQGQQLQMAVKDVLTNPAYAVPLKNMMIDPRFAGQFAKALSKEQKDIHKGLMKDPEYQQSLIDVMKNPDYERILLDVMKGTQYRQQMMTVIRDTLQNPLYKQQMLSLMQTALEEHAKPKPDAQKGQQAGGGKDKGGGGGQDKSDQDKSGQDQDGGGQDQGDGGDGGTDSGDGGDQTGGDQTKKKDKKQSGS